VVALPNEIFVIQQPVGEVRLKNAKVVGRRDRPAGMVAYTRGGRIHRVRPRIMMAASVATRLGDTRPASAHVDTPARKQLNRPYSALPLTHHRIESRLIRPPIMLAIVCLDETVPQRQPEIPCSPRIHSLAGVLIVTRIVLRSPPNSRAAKPQSPAPAHCLHARVRQRLRNHPLHASPRPWPQPKEPGIRYPTMQSVQGRVTSSYPSGR